VSDADAPAQITGVATLSVMLGVVPTETVAVSVPEAHPAKVYVTV
jgi:hypothetical protein